MLAEPFEDWAKGPDRKFGSANRKITLIIDKCTAHSHVENLEWIELIFLPPSTMSHTKPIDQGVIRALKAKYCSPTVRKLISALEKKELVPTISILSAMIC